MGKLLSSVLVVMMKCGCISSVLDVIEKRIIHICAIANLIINKQILKEILIKTYQFKCTVAPNYLRVNIASDVSLRRLRSAASPLLDDNLAIAPNTQTKHANSPLSTHLEVTVT